MAPFVPFFLTYITIEPRCQRKLRREFPFFGKKWMQNKVKTVEIAVKQNGKEYFACGVHILSKGDEV